MEIYGFHGNPWISVKSTDLLWIQAYIHWKPYKTGRSKWEAQGKTSLFQRRSADFTEICGFPVKSTFICQIPTGKHLSITKDHLPRKGYTICTREFIRFTAYPVRHNLVFAKWIWQIRQICLILLKCLAFIPSTSKWAENVLNVDFISHSRMK